MILSERIVQKIEMGWGSANFLDQYWSNIKIETGDEPRSIHYSFGGRDKLKTLIKKLHTKIGNSEIADRHVVIGSGATQVLLALLSVMKNDSFSSAYAKEPFFFRFPQLASSAGLKWVFDKTVGTVSICTSPNNPDSSVSIDDTAEILDLCYNWPQYTEVKKHDHPVMVYSLSKATGHASTRIGWALIKDEVLAKRLESYLEVITGGIPVESQIMAEKVIESQILMPVNNTVFAYGKHVLDSRWEQINKLKDLDIPIRIHNSSGMFMWCEVKDPETFLKFKQNVNYLDGTTMGSTEDFIRLNAGCSRDSFEQFVSLVKNI